MSADANRLALRAAQEPLFRRQLELCAAAHPYYRRVFHERGVDPDRIRGLDDLHLLPLTRKENLAAAPEDFRLRLDQLPPGAVTPEELTLRDVIYTTGSSGRPTPFFDTTHDHFSRIHQMRRAAEIGGLSPSDVVLNLFPLTSVPHQGFLSALWGTLGVGARLVGGMTGRPYPPFPIHNSLDQAVALAESSRATALWGIATYLRRVVMRAQELGRDLGAVRLVYAMGEACPAGMRADIRARLASVGAGDVRVVNGYGFTEMQGPAMECAELSGFHLPTPTQFHFELLDPSTLEPAPEGQPGLLVITHLNRRGTVLLRYVVGDAGTIDFATCPRCGRAEPRLGIPYRVGNLVKVKGTLVNPAAIHDELTRLQTEGLLEYQIAIVKDDPADPYSADALLVRLACDPTRREALAASVRGRVLAAAEVTPRLEFVPPDAFSDQVQNYKFKRFVDERGGTQ